MRHLEAWASYSAMSVESFQELLHLGAAADKARAPVQRCASRRVLAVPAPTSSNTSTGAPSPLIGTGPSGATWTKPSANCSVPAVSRLLPGAAKQAPHLPRRVHACSLETAVSIRV